MISHSKTALLSFRIVIVFDDLFTGNQSHSTGRDPSMIPPLSPKIVYYSSCLCPDTSYVWVLFLAYWM